MWMKKSVSPAKGAIAGLIGGLFASWIMNRFQDGVSHISKRFNEEEADRQWSREQARHLRHQASEGEEEPATVKAAVAVAEKVFDHELEPEEKRPAGTIVHYAYGAAIGALYGWAAERSELARSASGTLFGATLWFGSDEIGVPMFGLSKKPTEYPLSTHASALAAHVVYGVTTELVRRSLRRGYLSS
jgi:hypothetical protein